MENVDLEKALEVLNLIASERGKHEYAEGKSFKMDCPFCGAAESFCVIWSRYSVSGGCSACGVPFHIRLKG